MKLPPRITPAECDTLSGWDIWLFMTAAKNAVYWRDRMAWVESEELKAFYRKFARRHAADARSYQERMIRDLAYE
jgi:hypothetical protein